MSDVHHQRITVQMGGFLEDGALLLAGDELLAVVIFLTPEVYVNDPFLAGKWFVEVGFGPCAVGSETVLFDSLDEGVAWAAAAYRRRTV